MKQSQAKVDIISRHWKDAEESNPHASTEMLLSLVADRCYVTIPEVSAALKQAGIFREVK